MAKQKAYVRINSSERCWYEIVEFEVSDEDINIGISLKKGNTELKEKLDSVLSTMTEEDFTELMDQAISVQPLSK